MRLFNRAEHYEDESSYTFHWYECNPFYQLSLLRWVNTKKGWHPKRKRLARLRAFYWTLFRPPCLSDLAKAAGLPFLRWTCSIDDSILRWNE